MALAVLFFFSRVLRVLFSRKLSIPDESTALAHGVWDV